MTDGAHLAAGARLIASLVRSLSRPIAVIGWKRSIVISDPPRRLADRAEQRLPTGFGQRWKSFAASGW
jgi:hypothetical protein